VVSRFRRDEFIEARKAVVWRVVAEQDSTGGGDRDRRRGLEKAGDRRWQIECGVKDGFDLAGRAPGSGDQVAARALFPRRKVSAVVSFMPKVAAEADLPGNLPSRRCNLKP
jgi:hypothetical protein